MYLLVMYVRDPDLFQAFYSHFDLDFVQEKHGKGPVHYACETGDMVLEFYPSKGYITDTIRLGFHVDSVSDTLENLQSEFPDVAIAKSSEESATILDPQGNYIFLTKKV